MIFPSRPPRDGDAAAAPVSDVDVAIAAARAGARVVRRGYGRRLDRIDKGAGDFATDVDIAAERAIVDVLLAARPADAVMGEEAGRQGSVTSGRLWLVDPLCGTLNYAAGNALVAVNVALVGGAAAVADPFAKEIFHTDGQGAAHLRRTGGSSGSGHSRRDEPLVPTAETRLVDVNLDPPFPNAPGFRAVDLLADPAFAARFRPRVMSTTLALAWVAAGRRAGYVTDGGDLTASAHFAAGIALCRAAGCVVSGLDGAPLDPCTAGGSASPTARGLVVAADQETHSALISMIRR